MDEEKRNGCHIVDGEEIAERTVTECLRYHIEVQRHPSIRKYLEEEDEEADTGEGDEDPEEPAA